MKFIPRPYQARAIDLVLKQPNIQINAFMGGGKTAVVLHALDRLLPANRCLIVAPKRVAESTWPDEIAKWELKIPYSVIVGTVPTRRKKLAEDTPLHIINFENLVWLYKALEPNWPYDIVVIDESSKVKSHATNRFKTLKKIKQQTSRWINLTGTPMPHGVMDLWSQMYLLDEGKALGKNITAFRNRWFHQDYMGYNWIPHDHSEVEIQERIKPLCFTLTKDDNSELPQAIKTEHRVRLSWGDMRAYRVLEEEFLLNLGKAEIEAANAAVLTSKLQQYAQGALYVDEQGAWEEAHTAKLESLNEIIEGSEGPALVAYTFKSDLARLKAAYPSARTLSGPKDVTDWNSGKIDVLLAHPASCGHGLNLQDGGSVMIWFGLNWSLELYEQMNARLDRSGQKGTVVIHHIIAKNTVDEAIMVRLKKKCAAQQALMDYLKR